ncbi:MAG: hypothetical protein OXU20_19175 [Myxococcales bacterium]|nr:hypothetical protein [Myxococcales bacterium]
MLAQRIYASGDSAWRARYVDPETDRLVWEKLEPALRTREARRAWAMRKAEALSHRRAELTSGAPRRGRTPIDHAIKDFWTSCEARLRASTVATYRHGINHFESWTVTTGINLSEDLTPPQLRAFREHLITCSKRKSVKGGRRGLQAASSSRRHPVTINTYLTSTKVLLNHWRALGLTPDLTKDAISDALKRLPVPREDPEFLRPTQIARLLDAALRHDTAVYAETREEHAGQRPRGTTPRHPPITPLVVFLLLSGCRRGEGLALRWSDVDLDATDQDGRVVGEIRLRAEATKTKRARTIGLEVSPVLRRVLATMKLRARKTDAFVFGGEQPYTQDLIDSARARLQNEFGAPAFTWKLLRSTCSTYLTNAPGIWGNAAHFLSAKQLGHSVEVAERHYAGVLRSVPRDARTLEAAMGIEGALGRIMGVMGAAGRPHARSVRTLEWQPG